MEDLGLLLEAVVAKLRELGAGPELFEELEAIMTRRLQEIDDADSIVPVGAVSHPTGCVSVAIARASWPRWRTVRG
jgi:hypothetical protein